MRGSGADWPSTVGLKRTQRVSQNSTRPRSDCCATFTAYITEASSLPLNRAICSRQFSFGFGFLVSIHGSQQLLADHSKSVEAVNEKLETSNPNPQTRNPKPETLKPTGFPLSCNPNRFITVFVNQDFRHGFRYSSTTPISQTCSQQENPMKLRLPALAAFTLLVASASASAREVKLVRYAHYHQGRIVFTYLADIWTASEDGRDVKRITVHHARDVYPRFSPDGRWIAFSSDRNGNMDVFIVPSEGGTPKQLTFHSADDTVLGWTPDSKAVLFSSNRGDDFMPRLYTVAVDGGIERNVGSDMGISACFSPDGTKLAINRKGQVYWRKYYHGAMNTDVTV